MSIISKPKKKLLSPGRPLLRYPGGKFRGAKKIFEFIDDLLKKTGKIGEYDQKV